MKFRKNSETINSYDVNFSKIFGEDFYSLAERLAKEHNVDEDALIDLLSEYLGQNDFTHKIGGYPSFTQDDPRKSNSPLRLLLQLNSEDDVMMWGDVGIAGFFIDPDNLSKSDFSQVMYSWDCS
jgi:uncharacterized protein YwqG